MSITIDDGQLITKDPASIQTYLIDWGAVNLDAGVAIASQTMAVAALRPSKVDAALTVNTTGTGLGILAGSRTIGVQLAAGTVGQLYELTSRIVTNETPAQTKERSIRVLVENL